MNRCRTCQYWGKKASDDELLATYPTNLALREWWLTRTCSAIRDCPGGIEIGVSGGWNGATVDYVETNANFGCVFHTERV